MGLWSVLIFCHDIVANFAFRWLRGKSSSVTTPKGAASERGSNFYTTNKILNVKFELSRVTLKRTFSLFKSSKKLFKFLEKTKIP